MFCSFPIVISAIQFIQTVYNVSFTRMPLLLAGNGFQNLLKWYIFELLYYEFSVSFNRGFKICFLFCRFQPLVCYF